MPKVEIAFLFETLLETLYTQDSEVMYALSYYIQNYHLYYPYILFL